MACLLFATSTLAGTEARAGVVYTWGSNQWGQIGDGTMVDQRDSPVAVVGLTNGVTAAAGGGEHSLALQNGAVYAWGSNDVGQLGIGMGVSGMEYLPIAVTGLPSGVTAITAGKSNSLAVQNGGVYEWGYDPMFPTQNNYTPFAVSGLSSGVTAIAAGDEFSLAVKNGAVYAWGTNLAGQLGNGTTGAAPAAPVAVPALSSGVTAVAAGQGFSLAVQNGEVYAWGFNNVGQLGDGTTTNSSTPVAVPALSSGVTAVAAGASHSLALQNGHVYAWGENGEGQLGNGTTDDLDMPPELVDPTDLWNIIAVAAGGGSSYALSSDGSLWVWGHNINGQLGLGDDGEYDYLTPQHLLSPSGYIYTSISANCNGYQAVATLTAVPEPATFVLAGIGFLSLLTCVRQRRSRQCYIE